MPTWTEVLGNRAKRGEKPLGVSRGLEPLHASLPLAGRLVGILRAVVQGAVLSGAYRKIKRAFPPPAAPTLSSTPRHLQCPQRASAAAAASPAWAARRPALRTGGG